MGAKIGKSTTETNISTTEETRQEECSVESRDELSEGCGSVQNGSGSRPCSVPYRGSRPSEDSGDNDDWNDAKESFDSVDAIKEKNGEDVRTSEEKEMKPKCLSAEVKITKDEEVKSESKGDGSLSVNGEEKWGERDRGILKDQKRKTAKKQKEEERRNKATAEDHELGKKNNDEEIKFFALYSSEDAKEDKAERSEASEINEISNITKEENVGKDINEDKGLSAEVLVDENAGKDKSIERKSEDGKKLLPEKSESEEENTEENRELFYEENDDLEKNEDKELLSEVNEDKELLSEVNEDKELLPEVNTNKEQLSEVNKDKEQLSEVNTDKELLSEVNNDKVMEKDKELPDNGLDGQAEKEEQIKDTETRASDEGHVTQELEQDDATGKRKATETDGQTTDNVANESDNGSEKSALKCKTGVKEEMEGNVGEDAEVLANKKSEIQVVESKKNLEVVSAEDCIRGKHDLETKDNGNIRKEPENEDGKSDAKGREVAENGEVHEDPGVGLSDPSELVDKAKKVQPTESRWKLGKKLGRGSTLDFDNFMPSACVTFLRVPTPKTYAALNRKLKSCDRKWMTGFLEEGGLDALLQSVNSISSRKIQLADAMMLLECVACVRTVMNSKIGLQVITERWEYAEILLAALITPNVMLKKQVMDLLSALCVSSDQGFNVCMQAINSLKSTRNERYRFSALVAELRSDPTPVYAASVMAFINCLIVRNQDIKARMRLRNEFIGLNILDIVKELKELDDDELTIQCDVFCDEKHSDEDSVSADEENFKGIDLTNHLDVFNAIYEQVYNTPQSSVFLNMLCDLLLINKDDKDFQLRWLAADAIVHKVVHSKKPEDLENEEEFLAKLAAARSPIASDTTQKTMTLTCPPPPPPAPPPPPPFPGGFVAPSPPCGTVPPPPPPPPFAQPSGPPPPPPPLPPPLACGGGPPPPPPPPPFPGCSVPPPPPPPFPGASGAPLPPPPPPPPLSSDSEDGSGSGISSVIGITYGTSASAVLQVTAPIPKGKATPVPKAKMKTINWIKVPKNVVSAQEVLWRDVLEMEDEVPMDFNAVEELFSRKTAPVTTEAKAVEKKQPTEINLFDMKRSMSINVWLKQFKMAADDIVAILREADEEKFGTERLRSLQKLLPDQSESEMLRSYDGDREKLGSAEKFCIALMELPSYKVRIEAMLLRGEFQGNVESVQSKMDSIDRACHGIISSRSLKLFLKTVLQMGNFINAGSYAGDAIGFKISSLPTLWDTQANKRGVTLLHHLVELAAKQNHSIIEFVDDLSEPLQVASRISLDNISSESKQLSTSVANVENQLKVAENSVKEQFGEFIKLARERMNDLDIRLTEINELSLKLCRHLCEDKETFQLEECLKIFSNLCEHIKKCQKENEKRIIEEERALKRKKELQEKSKSFGSTVKKSEKERVAEVNKEDECLVDRLLEEIRRGTNLRQRATG